jgi:UDP-N-acetylmuramoyl-tripeptide--D-alanyl-D-alanine ligase
MSRPLWTSDEIAAAVGSSVVGAPFAASGLDIDTRALTPGDMFIALTGERDGNGFAANAFKAGASGALVSRAVEGGAYIQVDDTLAALVRLGVAARDRASARRIAVTGSVGKTSVTQAIFAALRLAGPSHGPVKSFNNHIGVPLTLSRMSRDTRFAVFEIGMNHAGEIGPLSKLVAPHVCVVTTVGPVHTENFPDGEAGVARAKAEIFEGLAPGGVAVLNADDVWFDLLADAARAHGAKVLSFGGAESCDAQLIAFERCSPLHHASRGLPAPMGQELNAAAPTEGACVTAVIHGERLTFSIAQTGAQWGPNSLATLLALEAVGISRAIGLQALAAFTPLQGRGAEQTLHTADGAFTLIDESYNANPVSMAAALATLGARPTQGRRIAVLTDMLELGSDAARHHAGLAAPIDAAKVDLVFCAGPMMTALWDGLPENRRGGYAASAAALAPAVAAAVRPGDVVMVKGSNGSNAAVVVQALISSVTLQTEPPPAAANARER